MCDAFILKGSRVIAVAVLLGVGAFLWTHEPLPAMPDSPPSKGQYEHMDAKTASVGAIGDMTNLIVTLALGLTAIVGFSIKDGFGEKPKLAAGAWVLVSLFVYCLVRVIVYGYDTYGAIAVQIQQGHLFSSYLEASLVLQVRSLIYAAPICISLLVIKLSR